PPTMRGMCSPDTDSGVLNYLLLSALVGHGGCACCGCLRIQVGATGVDHGAISGDFIDQWDTGWDIQLCDVLIRDVVQVLDQRAQGVAVCGDENVLTLLGAWQNLSLVIRDETLN